MQAQDLGAQLGLVLVAIRQLVGKRGVLAMQLIQFFLIGAGRGLQTGDLGTQPGGGLIALLQGVGERFVLTVQFVQLFFVDHFGFEFGYLSREGLILLAQPGDGLLFNEHFGVGALGSGGLALDFLLQAGDLLVLLGQQQLRLFIILLQKEQGRATRFGALGRLG